MRASGLLLAVLRVLWWWFLWVGCCLFGGFYMDVGRRKKKEILGKYPCEISLHLNNLL